MAISKKSFVDIDLQGNALVNPTIGLNSNMTKAGSFQYNAAELRLEYFNGTSVKQVANLSDIAAVTGGLIFQAGYDPTTNTPDITVDDDSVKKGFFWVATAAGTFLGEAVQVGDSIIAKLDNPGTTAANWLILQGNVVIATDTVDGIVKLATQAEVDAGTEGGAVVLTPATFAASQQLSEINTDITNLENDKLARDGSQAMTGHLDMANHNITGVNTIQSYITTTDNLQSAAANILLYSDINAQGTQKITGLAAPTDGGDAVNKTYADTKLPLDGSQAMTGNLDMSGNNVSGADIIFSNYVTTDHIGSSTGTLQLTGDLDAQNTGKVTNLPEPTNGGDAANKTYVDNNTNNKLPLSGGIMSGSIDMNNSDITHVNFIEIEAIGSVDGTTEVWSNLHLNGSGLSGVSTPVNGDDATNKTYVDSQIAAQSYTATIAPGDWEGDAMNGYTYYITHNLLALCTYSTYLLNGSNDWESADFSVLNSTYTSCEIRCNNLPSTDVRISLVRASGNL